MDKDYHEMIDIWVSYILLLYFIFYIFFSLASENVHAPEHGVVGYAAHPRVAKISGRARSGRPLVMMLDTGARFTVVAEDLLTTLQVPPTGFTEVRTSLHDVVQRPVYRVAVSLGFVDVYGGQNTAELLLGVIGSPPAPTNLPGDMVVPHRGLLGLDFLNHFRLVYDGPENRFELTCNQLPSLSSAND